MKKEIIEQMKAIVAAKRPNGDKLISNDFNRILESLETYDKDFIWGIDVVGSYMDLDKIDQFYFQDRLRNEKERYLYQQGNGVGYDGTYFHKTYHPHYEWYVYRHLGNGLTQTTLDECMRLRKAILRDVVGTMKAEGVEFPTNFKIPVHFSCGLGYVMEQLRYAAAHNDDSLIEQLRKFRRHLKLSDEHEVNIGKDWEKRCFSFGEYVNDKAVLCGAIIYHGYPDEGYRQNFSVQLEPSYGWSMHT